VTFRMYFFICYVACYVALVPLFVSGGMLRNKINIILLF
jgi:hypothetical protein